MNAPSLTLPRFTGEGTDGTTQETQRQIELGSTAPSPVERGRVGEGDFVRSDFSLGGVMRGLAPRIHVLGDA